jgi:hypothetical protein
MNFIIIILFIIIITVFLVCLWIKKKYIRPYCRDDIIKIFEINSEYTIDTSHEISSPYKEFIEEYGIDVASNFKNANLYVFTDYTNMDKGLLQITFPKKYVWIKGMTGLDHLCSKSALAYYFKRSNNEDCIPKTWVLDEKKDIEDLSRDENTIYIAKKNIQRQDGIMITKDKDYLISGQAKHDEYVVVQTLLQNPFLIDERKINLRIYMFVVKHDDNFDFYIYNDGFMYYTKEKYIPESTEIAPNITTGYIDREVYLKNPLTLKDFGEYLGKERFDILNKNIFDLFRKIKTIYLPILKHTNDKFKGYCMFNLWGMDIAPDKDLNIKLIEANKGSSLVFMDDRDKNVKYNMIKDLFTLVGITNDAKPKNFIEIK